MSGGSCYWRMSELTPERLASYNPSHSSGKETFSVVDEETVPTQEPPAPETRMARRLPWPMIVVAGIFVVVAFMSWYGSWFGRPLSDSQIETYLSDSEKPRNAQHALSYIANRIIEGDQSIKRWYPAVISSSSHPTPQVRSFAAWVMGQDNSSEAFHSALQQLLKDSDAGVRHNAALSLVRFNDSSGRSELTAMLESQTVKADGGGIAELIINDEGIQVAPASPLVRIKQDDGQTREIHAQQESRVELLKVSDGDRVEEGSELLVMAPSTEQAWEALRALYIVGQPDDVRFIERYARPFAGLPDRVQKQALATIEAIRTRGQTGATLRKPERTPSNE
jgi:HEAT repeats